MDDALPLVIDILKKKHGFSTPEYRVVSYDWALSKRLERFVDSRLRKAIPPELLERVLEHNERAWERQLRRPKDV